MNSWAVRGWLLVAASLALAYGGWISYRLNRDEELSALPSAAPARAMAAETSAKDARPVADFLLTDQNGQPFGTRDLRGQVWVASFFFAGCAGTCRQLNLSLSAVQKDAPQDVRLVSITCDPDNDTPEQLARYAEVFAADPERWKFLTGDMKDLERVGRDIFQVALEKQTHTEKAFVIDRQGRLRGRYNVLDPDQLEKLKSLVARVDAEP